MSSGFTSALSSVLNDRHQQIVDSVIGSGAGKRKRLYYTQEQRCEIGKYAHNHGVSEAVTKFRTRFESLTKGTVSKHKKLYEQALINCGANENVVKVGLKRGRPTILPEELMSEVKQLVIAVRANGGVINRVTVKSMD